MNLIEAIKLYRLYGKFQAVMKDKVSMSIKIAQIVALLVQVLGFTGAAVVAGQWVNSHLIVIVIINAVLVIGHALLPSIIPGPIAPTPSNTVGVKTGMIPLVAALAMTFAAPPMKAQTVTQVQNIYAAGASYSVGATPAVAGTALYAHNLNTGSALPTFAFTVIDASPTTISPFSVTSNIGVGIAQQIATVGKIPIYVPTSAGISWSGSNTGWQWNGGALASIHLKGQYYLMPSVRFLKSSVSNGTGYQLIPGLLFAWGK